MKQEMFLRYMNLPLLKINVCVFFSLFPSVNRHLQYIKKTGPHVWRQLHGTCVFQQEHLAATWMMSRGEESRWNWDADCAAKSVFNRKNRLKVTEQCGQNQKKKKKKSTSLDPKLNTNTELTWTKGDKCPISEYVCLEVHHLTLLTSLHCAKYFDSNQGFLLH